MAQRSMGAVLRSYAQPPAIEELEVDEPLPQEVLVRVHACGVCHSDLTFSRGGLPHYAMPAVMGHEVAGVVLRTGSAVTSVAPGDAVVACSTIACGQCAVCLRGFAHLCPERARFGRTPDQRPRMRGADGPLAPFAGVGGLCSHILVPEIALVRVPPEMPLDRAALLGCAVLTGVGAALHTAQVAPGASVVVFGCGAVGSAVVQGARIAGAAQIIGVDLSEDKLRLARDFGATHTLRAGDDADIVAQILDLTGGGAHYAFDAVGDAGVLAQAFDCLAPRGLAVLVGSVRPGQRISLDGRGLLREKRVTGSFMGSNQYRRDIPYYAELYRQGRLDLDRMVSSTVPLSRLHEAFDRMEGGSAVRTIVTFP